MRNLYLKALEKHLLKRETLHEDLKKIGKIVSICYNNTDYSDFFNFWKYMNAVKLWNMIGGLVCNDEADGDIYERKFRTLNKCNNNIMGTTEGLLIFYVRFK